MTSIDDPEHLRLRAAEMRDRADKAKSAETKQALSRIAEDFEVLAKRAEERLATLRRRADGSDQRPDTDPTEP